MTHRCATCGRYSRDRKQEALRERVHEDLRATVEPPSFDPTAIVLGILTGAVLVWAAFAAI